MAVSEEIKRLLDEALRISELPLEERNDAISQAAKPVHEADFFDVQAKLRQLPTILNQLHDARIGTIRYQMGHS